MSLASIPLNRPTLMGFELRYIRDALRRRQISGDGYYTRRCSAYLEKLLGAPRVLLTSSATHALELAFLLMPTEPGQEVLCPSFTFPSTANAFVLRGLKPRFVDIRSDTLNMDERLLESAITRHTVAITPVHYAGVPCRMDKIMQTATQHQLAVIEDAAQALGARFRGRPAATFGAMSAFSFHETKNCMCGEGGALVIQDPRFIERAEIIRQKGTNREQFYRGEINKYSWVDIGSSYVPSELQTAFLLAQIEKLELIRQKRRRLHENYMQALRPFEDAGHLQLPVIPPDCDSAYHLFYILCRSAREQTRIMKALQAKKIHATFHFFPLHLSAMGKRYGYRAGDFPVTESVSQRLLRLPFYTAMTHREQRRVIQALKDLF